MKELPERQKENKKKEILENKCPCPKELIDNILLFSHL